MKSTMKEVLVALLVGGAVSRVIAGPSADNVTSNTVAYWPFDRGAELADATGHGHALDNTGVAFSAEAAVFDANQSSKLVTAAPLAFSAYTNLTIECFFNMEGTYFNSGFGFLFTSAAGYGDPGTVNCYQTDKTSVLADFFNTDREFDQETSQQRYSLGAGSWHHAALVIDGTKSGQDPDRLQLYIDRVRMRATYINASHAGLSDALLYIGTLGTQTGYHFNGQMDDVRITAAALSPGEFLQTRTRTANTVAYWPFNPGDELADASGHGHTLSNNQVTFENGAACFSSARASGLATLSALPFEDSADATVEFFFCTTSQTSAYRMLLMTGETYGLPGSLSCYGQPDKDNLMNDYHDSEGRYQSRLATGNICDGKWHHVAILVDSTKTGLDPERLRMYVDRVEQPCPRVFSLDAVLRNRVLYLGTQGTQNAAYFDGQMDDVRITAAVLSPGEFLQTRTRTANTNCIAYWPFNPGDELTDASGHGHALSNNQVTFKNGAACFSRALSSWLATQSALPFEDSADATVEFFFCTTNCSSAYRMLLMTGETYGLPGSLSCYGEPDLDNLVNDFHDSAGRYHTRVAAGNICDGKWHHVAILVDSSKTGRDSDRLKLYLDRVEQPFRSANGWDAGLRNRILYLGTQGTQNRAFFDGRMDDVRITGRLLSTNEFLAATDRTGSYGCVAYWPFKDGRELEDASGNGYSLENSGVTFYAGSAVFDKNLASRLVTTSAIPFGELVDVTLEYFVRTAYVPPVGSFSVITHAGPSYGEPGSFASYVNFGNKLETDVTQVYFDLFNQERSRVGLLTDGQWHHVAVVIERSAFPTDPDNWFRLYVDGVRQLDESTVHRTTQPFLSDNRFYLGSCGLRTYDYYSGRLDDVKITGAALSPSEFMTRRTFNEGTTLTIR